jgi:hypothetical protein
MRTKDKLELFAKSDYRQLPYCTWMWYGTFFSFKPILKGEVFEELLKTKGLVIGFSATALFYYFDRFDQEKKEMIRLFPLAIRSYKLASGLSRQKRQEIEKGIEKVPIEYDRLGEILEPSFIYSISLSTDTYYSFWMNVLKEFNLCINSSRSVYSTNARSI